MPLEMDNLEKSFFETVNNTIETKLVDVREIKCRSVHTVKCTIKMTTHMTQECEFRVFEFTHSSQSKIDADNSAMKSMKLRRPASGYGYVRDPVVFLSTVTLN